MNALYTSILCVLAVETTGRLRAQETTALATTASMGCLLIYQETSDLVAVGPDVAGRQQWLQPVAARVWRGMQAAGRGGRWGLAASGVGVSKRRPAAADLRAQAARRSDARGHPGRQRPAGLQPAPHRNGLDIVTPGSTALSGGFEGRAAFRWLGAHAHDYGFSLTYPRGNASGMAYEPWHWASGQLEAGRGRCRPVAIAHLGRAFLRDGPVLDGAGVAARLN